MITIVQNKNEEEIEKLIEENIGVVSNLKDAYIGARYLPYIFEKKQVEKMMVFVINY